MRAACADAMKPPVEEDGSQKNCARIAPELRPNCAVRTVLGEHEHDDEEHVQRVRPERPRLVQRADEGEQQRVRVGARERVVAKVGVAVEQQVEQQHGALGRQRGGDRVVERPERQLAGAHAALLRVGRAAALGVVVVGGVGGAGALLVADGAEGGEEGVAMRQVAGERRRQALRQQQQRVQRAVGERRRRPAVAALAAPKVGEHGPRQVERGADGPPHQRRRAGRRRRGGDVAEQPQREAFGAERVAGERGERHRLRRGRAELAEDLRRHAHGDGGEALGVQRVRLGVRRRRVVERRVGERREQRVDERQAELGGRDERRAAGRHRRRDRLERRRAELQVRQQLLRLERLDHVPQEEAHEEDAARRLLQHGRRRPPPPRRRRLREKAEDERLKIAGAPIVAQEFGADDVRGR